ncbi:MAG: hypothetical protein Q7K57_36465 [Burkholderiaceae bacterium]|nr:hypothetical protein [Burkholderiaceae bacterium]
MKTYKLNTEKKPLQHQNCSGFNCLIAALSEEGENKDKERQGVASIIGLMPKYAPRHYSATNNVSDG